MRLNIKADMKVTEETGQAYRIPRGSVLALNDARVLMHGDTTVITGWIEVGDERVSVVERIRGTLEA